MYRRVDWMKAADHSILQLIGPPQNLELRTGDIAHNAGLSPQYTSERLSILIDHGLVEKIAEKGSHPRYTTTEKGRRYLRGELAVEDLQEDDNGD